MSRDNISREALLDDLRLQIEELDDKELRSLIQLSHAVNRPTSSDKIQRFILAATNTRDHTPSFQTAAHQHSLELYDQIMGQLNLLANREN